MSRAGIALAWFNDEYEPFELPAAPQRQIPEGVKRNRRRDQQQRHRHAPSPGQIGARSRIPEAGTGDAV